MSTVAAEKQLRSTILIGEQVRIPGWVVDLPSFRRWARSDEFPERGRFAHLDGNLWVDLSMERSVHSRIVIKIGAVLALLAEQEGIGLYYGDRMCLTNPEAGLSTEPDGTLVSSVALDAGRVRLEEGDDSLEILGTPDMVLEVISPTSVKKDTEVLPRLYAQAGIPEFWLVDSRQPEPHVEIFRRGRSKYSAVRPSAGWVKSAVFGKSFRLVRRDAGHGVSEFTLEVR